nr:PREDICTED: hydroxylysine kinase isoform X2 [Megachile rotundata]
MEDKNAVLMPGQIIRPPTNKQIALELLEQHYGLKASSVTELNAYDDRNYHVICQESHRNPYIKLISKHGYVLKIINSLDSRKGHVIEAQTEMLIYLNHRNINCPSPIKTLKARLDNVLMGFSHPAYTSHKTLWMLASVPKLRQFTYAVKNTLERDLAHEVISVFEEEVLQVTSQLEQGIIHGDLNEQNIVVSSNSREIAAVIDFGDSHITCLIFELAITLCYMILQAGDVMMGKYVVEGYQDVRKLTNLEKEILKITVCTRLCQSLVMGAYSHHHDPQNEYLLYTQKSGWSLLKKLWSLSQNEVLRDWGLLD